MGSGRDGCGVSGKGGGRCVSRRKTEAVYPYFGRGFFDQLDSDTQ